MKEVMAHKGWTTPQQVADVAGVSRSAAAQWLGQGSKIIHSIGNMEAAERLERDTGFAALWIAKGVGPKRIGSGPKATVPEWPFPKIDEAKVYAMSGDDAVALERAFIVAASNVGLDIKKDA